MATRAVGLVNGPRAVRRRAVFGAALLIAAAWMAGGYGGPEPAVRAQPGAAAAEPPGLRSIAHVGGAMNGLVVDGEVVYIGEGPDVVAIRLDADAQLTIVHRTTLPDAITSLAIAPEVDRLYAAAGDAVYALAIAEGRPPTVVGEAAVPLADDSRIVAKGTHVYARVERAARNRSRCVAAIAFDGAAARGTVGPFVCATDIPGDAWLFGDRLALGDAVLAVYRPDAMARDDGVPEVALFDVREPAKPRFARSMALPNAIDGAVMAGDRLWVVDDGLGPTTMRSFDVSDPDREPTVAAEGAVSGSINGIFVAEGEVWLTGNGQQAFRPDATGPLTPTKQRWTYGCYGAYMTSGHVTATRNTLLMLSPSLLWVCRMPQDDTHVVHEMASWYGDENVSDHVAAAGGRTFARGSSASWLTQRVHALPSGLAPYGTFGLPPVTIGPEERYQQVEAFDADADHLVVANDLYASAFRLPVDDRPVPEAMWPIPGGVTESDTQAVAVAGDRATVLRSGELVVIDLARPEAPGARIADRWRAGHGLAGGSDWAAVLAGGEVRGRQRTAPHIVLVDVRATPPAVLGELTMADWTGWYPSGIARVGDLLAVTLWRRSGGTGATPLHSEGEVVIVTAADPLQPAVVGRVALSSGAGAEGHTIAAADGLVVVGGWAAPEGDPAAPLDGAQLGNRGALWVIDVTTPEQPVVSARHAVPGNPRDIAIDGRAVLVATGSGGLWRFELLRPGDAAATVWRLALPWLGPGQREARGQPIPMRSSPTTAP